MNASGVGKIVNSLGVHARPAAVLVKIAGSFEAEVFVSKDGIEVNAKSILGVLTLAAECGSELNVRAEGPDAEDAVRAILELLENGFGNDEPA